MTALEAATRWAFAQAKAGDAVLLSPACASLDMFRNYGHRAEVFVATVRELAERGRHGMSRPRFAACPGLPCWTPCAPASGVASPTRRGQLPVRDCQRQRPGAAAPA
jgi:hypothetical protein